MCAAGSVSAGRHRYGARAGYLPCRQPSGSLQQLPIHRAYQPQRLGGGASKGVVQTKRLIHGCAAHRPACRLRHLLHTRLHKPDAQLLTRIVCHTAVAGGAIVPRLRQYHHRRREVHHHSSRRSPLPRRTAERHRVCNQLPQRPGCRRNACRYHSKRRHNNLATHIAFGTGDAIVHSRPTALLLAADGC